MKAILGKKILMTRIFDTNGKQLPVSLIKIEENRVTQIKSLEKDKYQAIQVGAGKIRKLNKPATGHFKKTPNSPSPQYVYEIKTEKDYKLGDILKISQFEEGEKINITGMSKGKGFAGTVKRHNFNTGPKTHGSNNYRKPGSIGATDAARVFKGRRMAGHLGHKQTTTKNLKIVKIDMDKNEILIGGAVPGPKNNPVLIWRANES